MNAKESSPLVDYLFTLARTVGIGIPSYLLTGKLPDPNMQWASGAITVAAIVVSGKFQWRAGGTSTTESKRGLDLRWFSHRSEDQRGEVTPQIKQTKSRGSRTQRGSKNASPGASKLGQNLTRNNRRPSPDATPPSQPPRLDPPAPPPGGSRGKRPK